MEPDIDFVKAQVEATKFHLRMNRMMVSEAIKLMTEFMNQTVTSDGLLHEVDKKNNVWIERPKCSII